MRKLKADEIECRVAQVTQKGCSLLLYKTARVDRAILDEEFGQMSWQNDFKVIDGKMYGGIGVWNKELNQWIWKWDAGTESNTEAVKGEASDCFKRSGYKWSIGAELYTAPFIFVQLPTVSKGNGKYDLENKYIKFTVKEIGYSDKGEINKLVINDDKGNKVFEMGKSIKKQEPQKPNSDFVPDVIKEQEKKTNKLTVDDALEELQKYSEPSNAFNYFNSVINKVDDKKKFKDEFQAYYKKLKGEE